MTDKKISELIAGSVLSGDELVMIVQGGVTKRTTIADIMVGSSAVGGEALAGETDAMGIDFTYHTDITKQHYISDLTTPANNYNGTAQGKLTYTSPSVKMTRQSDGVWRYANHNFCLQSQTLDNAQWTLTRCTVSANATTAPDGTSTADKLVESNDTNSHFTTNAQTVAAVPLTYSVFAKAAERSWILLYQQEGYSRYFNLGAGTLGATEGITPDASAITSVGNGWYKCSITILAPSGTNKSLNIFTASADSTFSYAGDGSSGVYLWGAQVKRTPVNDANGYTYATGYLATTTTALYDLPYEWDVANASQGILIEEGRTNLVTGSQVLVTFFTLSGSTAAADQTTAPDGTSTADKWTNDTANSTHGVFAQPAFTAAAHAYSVFAKGGTGRYFNLAISDGTNYYAATYDLQAGSVTQTRQVNWSAPTATIIDAGNGWYRCALVGTPAAANNYITMSAASAGTIGSPDAHGRESFVGASETYFVWGMQLELGRYPTSPIHTIAATVTRAKDVFDLPIAAFPYGDSAGSFVVSGSIPGNPADRGYKSMFEARAASLNERHLMYIGNLADDFIAEIFDGGAQQGPLTGNSLDNAVTANTVFKAAYAYAANDLVAIVNGGTAATDATATMPTPDYSLEIGHIASDSQLNGHLRQFTYLKRRATNVELQSRTV